MSAAGSHPVRGTVRGSPRNNTEKPAQPPARPPKAYLLGVVESLFHLRHDGVDIIALVNAWKQSASPAWGRGGDAG